MSDDATPVLPTSGSARPVLQPLHTDAVREFVVGTVVFALGWVGLAVFGDDQPSWWTQAALTGLIIGVVGSSYCLWRRDKRRRDAAAGIAPPTA